jgi:hypothetical protein
MSANRQKTSGVTTGVLAALLFSAAAYAADDGFTQQDVHEHGKVTFNIGIEDKTVSIALVAPAINVIGFEHAPRTEEHKAALVAAWNLFTKSKDLVELPGGAKCTLKNAHTHSPRWKNQKEQPAQEGERSAADRQADAEQGLHDGHNHSHGDHADYTVHITYSCERPDKLAWIKLSVMNKLRDVQEARVNVVTSTHQGSELFKSGKQRVPLK